MLILMIEGFLLLVGVWFFWFVLSLLFRELIGRLFVDFWVLGELGVEVDFGKFMCDIVGFF